MQILDNVKKVPGGLLLVPTAITAIINTIFPGALRIGGPLSGICSPLGTQSFIGMMLLVAGSQVKASQLGGTFARGGVFYVLPDEGSLEEAFPEFAGAGTRKTAGD